MSEDTKHHQRLIDALQVIGLRAQRVEEAARQQLEDAAALLEAAKRAIVQVKPDGENGGAQ